MEATLVALEVVAEPLKSMATILVDVCAYAGEYFVFLILIFLNVNHFFKKHELGSLQKCNLNKYISL